MRGKQTISLFVFIAFLSKLGISFSAKTWRYYPTGRNHHGYISTKTKFTLEHTGSSAEWISKRWFSEEHCIVQNSTSPKATAVCSIAGYHPFGILDQFFNKMDVENILVIKTPYCYEWHIALSSTFDNRSARSDGSFRLKFDLWIQERSEFEQKSTSLFPSKASKRVTKLFHQVGQEPSISASVGYSNDKIPFVFKDVEFSSNDSVWNVNLVLSTLELVKIKVDESTVGLLDCFIKATTFEIPDKTFAVAKILNISQFSQNDGLKLIQDDCSPNVLIIARNDHLLWTDDYFDTSLALVVPQHLLSSTPNGYKSMFTRLRNLLIHTGQETFMVDKNSSQISLIEGLPKGNQLDFSSHPWCHQDNLLDETISDTLVAWVNQSFVYRFVNTSLGFLPVNVPNYFKDQDFRLLDAKVNGICHCVFYLIESSTCPACNGSKIIGYTTRNDQANSWENVTQLLQEKSYLDDGSKWSFQFLPPNSFSMLLWNSRDVFYKKSKGEATAVRKKKGCGLSCGSESILEVVTSSNGEYLVLYEDNSLFYGRIGVDYIIQLNSSFPNNLETRLVFDLIGNAYVVSFNKSSSSVARKNYALDNEIFNSLYPDVLCPFSFGNLSSSNVLDKRESFEIWGYLVFQRIYLNDIQLIWNPSEDLLLTTSEQKEYYQDVIIVNKTFKFKEKRSENATFPATSSSFSVTLLPKINSMTCTRPFHKVFHFHVGCPPTRRVFIRDARSSDLSFSEEQKKFWLRLSTGNTFHPVISMYNENVLIRRVYSMFEIVELDGRTDFAVRVEQQNNQDRTIMSFDGSGSFKFSLVFEDKNASLCRTAVEFDVDVEDEQDSDYSYLEFACVILFTILIILFLVSNYLLYRKAFLQRHEEDDEAKNRLQEQQYLAQLQYFRQGGAKAPPSSTPAKPRDPELPQRRTAVVAGKSDRRGIRRSSVFERVSKGVFEDLKVQDRSQSLQEPPRELEDFGESSAASRRHTIAQ